MHVFVVVVEYTQGALVKMDGSTPNHSRSRPGSSEFGW
jgi:hypothetical protein